MRKFAILCFLGFACFATSMTLAPEQASAQSCTHLSQPGTCPFGVTPGSNSVSFLSNGGILWSDGSITLGNQCCQPESGIETGTGLTRLSPDQTLFDDFNDGSSCSGGSCDFDREARFNDDDDGVVDGYITTGDVYSDDDVYFETGDVYADDDDGYIQTGDVYDDDDNDVRSFFEWANFHTVPESLRSTTPVSEQLTLQQIVVGTVGPEGTLVATNTCDAGTSACGGGFAGTLFGEGVNSPLATGGCDYGSGLCGGDLWTPTDLPESICEPFCNSGPIDGGWIDTRNNRTIGPGVDPFGGGPGVYVDPETGEATDFDPEDPDSWPDNVKEARAKWDAQLERQFASESESRQQDREFVNNLTGGQSGSGDGTFQYPAQVEFNTYVDTLLDNNGIVPLKQAPLITDGVAPPVDGAGISLGNVGGKTVFVTQNDNGVGTVHDSRESAQQALGVSSGPTLTPETPATPPRPKITGDTIASFDGAVIAGKDYGSIEIIEGPDGKPHAVGTGAYAGHDFGEAKQSKWGGGWRPEGGPWVAPMDNSATSAKRAVTQSDRQAINQEIFTDGFESGDTSAWTSR